MIFYIFNFGSMVSVNFPYFFNNSLFGLVS